MLQLFMGPRDRLTFRVSTGEQPRLSLGDINIVPGLYTFRMRPQDDGSSSLSQTHQALENRPNHVIGHAAQRNDSCRSLA